jgi:hypothetical protein
MKYPILFVFFDFGNKHKDCFIETEAYSLQDAVSLAMKNLSRSEKICVKSCYSVQDGNFVNCSKFFEEQYHKYVAMWAKEERIKEYQEKQKSLMNEANKDLDALIYKNLNEASKGAR